MSTTDDRPWAATLESFLLHFAVPRGQPSTHRSLSGGAYYVPGPEHYLFIELYSRKIASGAGAALTEAPRHIGPVKVDLDFRSTSAEPVATPADIAHLARTFF